MPDGWEPHRELERIYTLQELMQECRKRAPVIMQLADEMLHDHTLPADTKLRVMDFVINRGYGKPRQHVVVFDPSDSKKIENPVKVYIPDNGRQSNIGPIIEFDDDA